jgi:hypothetical protein
MKGTSQRLCDDARKNKDAPLDLSAVQALPTTILSYRAKIGNGGTENLGGKFERGDGQFVGVFKKRQCYLTHFLPCATFGQ